MNTSASTGGKDIKINDLKVNGAKIGATVARFAAWWWGELRVLAPRRLENWLADGSARLRVRIRENNARLMLSVDGQEQVLGYCDLGNDSELDSKPDFDSLRQTIAANVPDSAGVEVELPQQQVLTSQFFLPLATEQTLNEVVRFEMDRFTPFNAEQVGYSWRIVERIPERDKLKIELNVVRRDYLSGVLARLSQLGLSVSAAYPGQAEFSPRAGGGSDHPAEQLPARQAISGKRDGARLNMLPADFQPRLDSLWNKTNKSLLTGLLILLGVVVLLPMYLQNNRIESLESEIAAISKDAATAGARQRLLVAHLEGQEILANKKNQQPAKLETILALTELLPSTTWVANLVIDDADISIRGESNKSSDLISILEQSGEFKNVEFASPVTSSRSTNTERYEIRMQLASPEPTSPAAPGVGTTAGVGQ